MSSAKVNQLQLLQQNLESIMLHKQQIESQLAEVNSALTQLEKAEKSYKILGKIMVAVSKEELNNSLNEQKEVAEVRLKNFIEQEKKIKENIEEVQKEVVKELKTKKSPKNE